MTDDWRDKMQKASNDAEKKADKAADPELQKITAEADQLRTIFDELKLTDKATYDQLVRVVDEATQKNESIAGVITRLKALGSAAATAALLVSHKTVHTAKPARTERIFRPMREPPFRDD